MQTGYNVVRAEEETGMFKGEERKEVKYGLVGAEESMRESVLMKTRVGRYVSG